MGCFWCSEDIFGRVKGVKSTAVGYMGGKVEHPTYEQVCTDRTGHAEVVQVEYDPAQVSYEELLSVFWANHDPTTPNRQGPDVGTQYRSAVFLPQSRAKGRCRSHKAKAAGLGRVQEKDSDRGIAGVAILEGRRIPPEVLPKVRAKDALTQPLFPKPTR